jgi:hypothetical protein
MRLLPLVIVALILVALAVIFTVRAIRAKRARALESVGYRPIQYDTDTDTVIGIQRGRLKIRVEARVPLDDPDHGNRVIEEFAAADTKARDWNSTKKALV